MCIESGIPIGVSRDLCPGLEPTIGITCGEPNTDVSETYEILSNSGCSGNANNTNPDEPLVVVSPAGDFRDNCSGNWITSVGGLNNVINNTAIYSFEILAAGCTPDVLIRFENIKYGISPDGMQIQVMSSICGGGSNGVMTGFTPKGMDCYEMRPSAGAPLPNGIYYIIVDGQNGQLVQYDLTLEITHGGPSCVVTPSDMPEMPTTTSAERCGQGDVTLTASGCDNGTIVWYDAPNNGTEVGTGTSFTTPSLVVSKSYYAACRIGNCED